MFDYNHVSSQTAAANYYNATNAVNTICYSVQTQRALRGGCLLEHFAGAMGGRRLPATELGWLKNEAV